MTAGGHGKARHFTAGLPILLTIGCLNCAPVGLNVAGVFGVCSRKTMVSLIIAYEIKIISLRRVQSSLQ